MAQAADVMLDICSSITGLHNPTRFLQTCRLFQQVVADIFQLPVRLPTDADAAAIGAALQAGAALEAASVADYVNSAAPPLQDEVLLCWLPTRDDGNCLCAAWSVPSQLHCYAESACPECPGSTAARRTPFSFRKSLRATPAGRCSAFWAVIIILYWRGLAHSRAIVRLRAQGR